MKMGIKRKDAIITVKWIFSLSFTTATSVFINIVGIKRYPTGNGDKKLYLRK